jgi:hypothetical protein
LALIDIRPVTEITDQGDERVGKISGFSLHAGVLAKSHQREKLERLYRFELAIKFLETN